MNLQNLQESICDTVSFLAGTLLRKRLWIRCFPLIFAKFLEHLFTEAEHLRATTSDSLTNFAKKASLGHP